MVRLISDFARSWHRLQGPPFGHVSVLNGAVIHVYTCGFVAKQVLRNTSADWNGAQLGGPVASVTICVARRSGGGACSPPET